MNKITTGKRVRVVSALVEGSSINGTARMTGISKPTILKLLADLGSACFRYHDEHVRNVPSKRVQVDEVWSFCFAKDKNLSEELKNKFGFGSVWTWTALDVDSKLMVSWLVGDRSAITANKFKSDVASRLSNRVQLTSDGYKAYLDATERAFGGEIDYAILEKLYTNPPREVRNHPL